MRPVGLPCANWQWKMSLGGSRWTSPFEELAVERRLLDEEYEEGRFIPDPDRGGGGNEAAAAATNGEEARAEVVVVDEDVAAFDDEGIIPLIWSSFFGWDFRFEGRNGILSQQTTVSLIYTRTELLQTDLEKSSND